MKLSRSIPLLALAITANAGAAPPQSILSASNDDQQSANGHRIPTPYESAVQGRRILALTPLGNLATTFPTTDKNGATADDGAYNTAENRPDGLGGIPHVMMEYVADCEDAGNPTLLAINVETTFKNVRAGSNVSLALQWTPPYPPTQRIEEAASSSLLSQLKSWFGRGAMEDDETPDTVPYSAANLPRFSLHGYLQKIDELSPSTLAECFVKKHPDARYWLPGSRVHKSEFLRLVVTQVYWVGGFGDRSYIGWLPVDEWKNVTRSEWEAISLPGEKKGWKEGDLFARSDL